MNAYESIIGLEIHVQLKTSSKMFCSCKNGFEDGRPNVNVCPICLGHPGTLPTLNAAAVESGLRLALALNLQVQLFSKFDRKNYFYPDLPKGYQISQYDQPLARDGVLTLNWKGEERSVRLERLHLEEDAAKLVHQGGASLVDFNRAGTPLVEMVTRPDLRSPAQARLFLQELQMVVRTLGVSDADMEKGQLRCDANISLRPTGEERLYPKTEIKNLNSFKSVERALEFEIHRQSELWERSEAPMQSTTRGWDEKSATTIEQRNKESEGDYRYFPEPDIPPLTFSAEQIEAIRRSLPELPQAKRRRFVEQYGFRSEDAAMLSYPTDRANFIEPVMSELYEWISTADDEEGDEAEKIERNKTKLAKLAAGWFGSELLKLMNAEGRKSLKGMKMTPENFAEFLTLIFQRRLNSSAGQKVLAAMVERGVDPTVFLEEAGLQQVSDASAIDEHVVAVINEYPDVAAEIRAGKERKLQFLVGQVMKKTGGHADPTIIVALLMKRI